MPKSTLKCVPYKYSKRIADDIVEAVEAGHFPRDAGEKAGIGAQTVADWLASGDAEIERRKTLDKSHWNYEIDCLVNLVIRVRRAQFSWADDKLRKLQKYAEKNEDSRLLLRLLEKRLPSWRDKEADQVIGALVKGLLAGVEAGEISEEGARFVLRLLQRIGAET